MRYVAAAASSLVAVWLAFVVLLVVMRPRGMRFREAVALMPDLVRMVHGLARDRAVPRRLRAWLWFLIAFLASPIDAVPDLIPVIGVADDVVLVYLVVRSVVRACGDEVLQRHWRGSSDGLRAVKAFLRIDREPVDGSSESGGT
jgi:uncharacterized membrane protein YkvA (DUF1232 family)